ncbi:MAG TPA: enoyl-CoA hydratase/isomerase family protein [Stellaceae bacterium]|nr:enoyl-CoA hydratase/isomerase family protein [Stellaceae bacterium]
MTSSEQILLERRGGLGIVTLNRPQALNTLSLAMYRRFDPALIEWSRDPTVRAVLVRGAGGRAFCAGGDVIAIYQARSQGPGASDYKADFFREEYELVRRVHRFPKPYIALIDGIAMGGGMGISINGTFRIVTEATFVAMPEVQIGLFPDIGATRFLNLCPGRIGLYLALTGKRLGAADALYCGFGTHFVARERLTEFTATLAGIRWRKGEERGQAEEALSRYSGDAGPASLPPLQAAIDRCFAGDSVAAILAALAKEEGEWAREAQDAMQRASPLSLAITFRQLGLGRGMEIEDALALEYRLTQHCMAGHDFFEGIRALLVEKDRKPRWQHRSIAAVSEAEIDGYFTAIGERELRFA